MEFTETTVMAKAKSKAATPSAGLIATDYNPTSIPEVPGAKSSEVKLPPSQTEMELQNGTLATMSVAERVEQRWKERVEREGKKVWSSPFLQAREREEINFPTKAKCLAWMKANQPMQIAQAKLQKGPWQPIPYIVEPKRTIADLVTPEQAELMEKMKSARDATADIRQMSLALANQDLKAGALMALTENAAIEKLPLLPEKELREAARQAWQRSRSGLLKAARKLCAAKGITLPF
jgi:hypothetical protein